MGSWCGWWLKVTWKSKTILVEKRTEYDMLFLVRFNNILCEMIWTFSTNGIKARSPSTPAQTLFKMKRERNPTSIELPVLHLKHLNTIPRHLKTGTSWSQAHDSTVIFFTSWNLPERLRLLINYRYVSSPGAPWSTILFISFSNDDLASPLKSVRPLNQSPRYKQAYSTPAV